MVRPRFRLIALGLMLAAACCSARAQSGPPAGYTLSDEPDLAFTSPDGATRIEQYKKETPDYDIHWQAWTRRGDKMSELKPEQDYPAGFRFTSDSRWLVRMQKTGAGYQDLFLYRRDADGFVSATKTSLSELAWAYFKGHADARRISPPDFHISAGLLKGTEEAYRWLGVTWPNNRYLAISLSGEMDTRHPKNGVKRLTGWRCRYDLETGKFDVPAVFAANNARALKGKTEDDD